MITISQLLESVDLDFEPRFVTKDEDGEITIFSHRPTAEKWCSEWREYEGDCKTFGELKLSEFDGKDWTECIYEVPRKVDYTKWVGKLCRLTNGKAKPRYAILDRVAVKPSIHPFEALGLRFSSCEPVRPDDDIIYKGE